MDMPSSVKVRIAPSPTGYLHIGRGQSGLYNWLFAKKMGGKFYLRIDDTDKERSTKEYEQSILDALEWMGLKWEDDFFRQSERTQLYRKALEKLLSEGKAFYCHHSQEELEAERQRQEYEKVPPRHECNHKNLPQGKQGGGIIRLAIDGDSDRRIIFDDVIRGPIEFKAALLGDISIARSIEDPLYHFTTVFDDAEMEITHVIRGEDHISNTPKQILIYEALDKKPPLFAHHPLILAPDRSKLSARHGAMALIEYKKDYLPDAIANFLGGLGFTFSKDIISKEEMIEEFDLSKVHKSGAIFDAKKLNWINSQYIKKLTPTEFKEVSGFDNVPDAAVPLITERLEKLSDAEQFSYLWQEPEYPKELLLWKTSSSEEVKNSLEQTVEIIQKTDITDESLRSALEELAGKIGNKGLVFWPLRAALSGKDKSPDPVQIAVVLEKEEVVKRITKAIGLLSA